jgi:hypothetical protein
MYIYTYICIYLEEAVVTGVRGQESLCCIVKLLPGALLAADMLF